MGLLDTIFSSRVALNGVELITRKTLNFEGDFEVEDDPENLQTNISLTAGVALGDHAATSVLGRAAGTAGDVADIAASADDRVFARSSGALSFVQVATAMIANLAVTAGKLADLAVTTAKLDDLGVTTDKLAANAVTDAKLRQGAALTVIGRSANSTGDVADIAAGSNDTLLRRVSNALSWGTLTLAMIPDGLITAAKLNSAVKRITPFHGRVTAMVNTAGSTSYAFPFGRNEGASITITIADGQARFNRSGNLKNFFAQCLTSSGDADTFTLALNINGADSALSLAGMAGDSTAVHSDSSNTVAVTAGDLLTVAKSNVSATLTNDLVWGFDFEETLT